MEIRRLNFDYFLIGCFCNNDVMKQVMKVKLISFIIIYRSLCTSNHMSGRAIWERLPE